MTQIAVGPATIDFTDQGTGHPVLLLHGGGGPATVAAWADRLAADRPARVIAPVHPGFAGTVRPDAVATVRDLAALYTELLDALDLHDVTVVGNSIGGWIAAEMAVIGSRRVSGYVLVDAVGLQVAEHPVVDFFSLSPAEIADRSYADPATYGIDPTTLPPEALAAMAGNRRMLGVYAGESMSDAALGDRLRSVCTPTLVVWGEADRISDVGLGRAFADAIPAARFELITGAGHLPQIEAPAALTNVVWAFVEESAHSPRRG
ncbi:alpha/beta fold hydrolase [Tsukamurella soli]|uniref:Alpha/beta hydrolase n=1 Tax=Tsukamurella soli TaxID=644556 RepID=A0ABP8JFY5_9ACTN